MPEATPPPLRADAQRNRRRILRAAGTVFVECGPDAPLERIARRAGVGIATVYRRFPSRANLIHSVAVDALARLYEAARAGERSGHDPFESLRRFMHTALDLGSGPILSSLSGRFAIRDALDDALGPARRDTGLPAQDLIVRAQAAGLLRPDVVFGDVALVVVRLSQPMPGVDPAEDRAIAHRHLAVYIDGLRTAVPPERRTPLPEPGVSAARFEILRSGAPHRSVPAS